MTFEVLIRDLERRERLMRRHHLGRTARDVHEAVRDLVALHSSDPATPHLGARARVPGFSIGDLDRALLEERVLWRLHAMRRTLFIVSAEDGPMVEAAAARDVAARERRKLEGWLSEEMPAAEISRLIARLEGQILDLLSDGCQLSTAEVSSALPQLNTQLSVGSGKWKTRVPLSSRLLFLMAMDGCLVRTRPVGSWRSSQYRWAATPTWFGQPIPPRAQPAARATLAKRYLAAFGPAKAQDLRWWTGWTVKQTGEALKRIGAATVRLDRGEEGFVLPDDMETTLEEPFTEISLLPALDPTPMGWKHRDWFLGPHAPQLFDRNGNIGPTVWKGGKVVGGWGQRPDGTVAVRLLEDIGIEAQRRVEEEAAELTVWLAGTVVTPRFRTPLESELSASST